ILGVLGRSHPFNTVRAAELQRWIAEGQYERILAGDYPKRGPEAEQRPIDRDIDEARDHYVKEAKAVVNDVGDTARRAAQPLAAGLADHLRAAGHAVFGPNRAAARIESSKAFAKEVMRRAGIPTAASQTFHALDAALAHIRGHVEPLVVKASGLAAGKGVVVCTTREEAVRTARAMLAEGSFGEAGREIVVEDFLQGEELSVLA